MNQLDEVGSNIKVRYDAIQLVTELKETLDSCWIGFFGGNNYSAPNVHTLNPSMIHFHP